MPATIHYSAQIPVPVAVLDLNEDIIALETCKKLLNQITERNVADDPHEGYKQLRMARAIVSTLHRYAWDKMRQEFLAPIRKKISHRKN